MAENLELDIMIPRPALQKTNHARHTVLYDARFGQLNYYSSSSGLLVKAASLRTTLPLHATTATSPIFSILTSGIIPSL